MVYLFVFFTSVLFWGLACKKDNSWSSKIFFVIAVSLPILLAALREEHIGTDVLWYLKRCYISALSTSNYPLYLRQNNDIEILFLTVVFVISRIFKNMFVIQGVIQGLITIPMMMTIWKNRLICNPVLSLCVYYLIFFMNNLNIMRQSIAMAFTLLAFTYFKEEKYKRFIILQLIAIGFHSSAVASLGIIMIYFLLETRIERIYSKLIVIAIILSIVFSRQIISFVVNVVPFFPKRYAMKTYMEGSMNIAVLDVILYCLNLVVTFLSTKKNNNDNKFLRIISILSFFGMYLSYSFGVANRIAMYWNQYLVLSLPRGRLLVKNNSKSIHLFYVLFILFLLTYWYYNFVFMGYTETYPYIIGI